MILQLGSVRLRKITLQDIELLRVWRNDDKIRKNMFYQEIISPEMQLIWFQQLKAEDFYFIIEQNNEKIGLVSLCEKENTKLGEVGLFIHNENYWGSPAPVFASLALLRFAFESRNLVELKAKVRKENSIAQSYNEQLGFSKEKNGFQELKVEDYHNKLAELIERFDSNRP